MNYINFTLGVSVTIGKQLQSEKSSTHGDMFINIDPLQDIE